MYVFIGHKQGLTGIGHPNGEHLWGNPSWLVFFFMFLKFPFLHRASITLVISNKSLGPTSHLRNFTEKSSLAGMALGGRYWFIMGENSKWKGKTIFSLLKLWYDRTVSGLYSKLINMLIKWHSLGLEGRLRETWDAIYMTFRKWSWVSTRYLNSPNQWQLSPFSIPMTTESLLNIWPLGKKSLFKHASLAGIFHF